MQVVINPFFHDKIVQFAVQFVLSSLFILMSGQCPSCLRFEFKGVSYAFSESPLSILRFSFGLQRREENLLSRRYYQLFQESFEKIGYSNLLMYEWDQGHSFTLLSGGGRPANQSVIDGWGSHFSSLQDWPGVVILQSITLLED